MSLILGNSIGSLGNETCRQTDGHEFSNVCELCANNRHIRKCTYSVRFLVHFVISKTAEFTKTLYWI
jgi:hypothetical protein